MTDAELDPALIARLIRIGGRELLTQLIDTFSADAPARREALTLASAAHDLPALAAVAHAIVAGAGQLGARKLSDDARALEQAARSGDAAGVDGRLPPFLARYDAALAALAHAREGA